jgi:hypothetical protein
LESKGKRSISSQSSDKENGSAIRGQNEALLEEKASSSPAAAEKISFSLNDQYF